MEYLQSLKMEKEIRLRSSELNKYIFLLEILTKVSNISGRYSAKLHPYKKHSDKKLW